MRFQCRRFFLNCPIRNKYCLWLPCLLTDRQEMENFYRGPSKDSFYQVWVHLLKRFQTENIFFRNPSIRKKNCLWRPCSITERNEMSNLDRGTFINASYEVSVQLTMRFQRGIFVKIDQSETIIACDGHLFQRIRTIWAILIEDLR
jgi:hypothetical protein